MKVKDFEILIARSVQTVRDRKRPLVASDAARQAASHAHLRLALALQIREITKKLFGKYERP